MKFLLAIFLVLSGNAVAQEHSVTRSDSGVLSIEGTVDQGKKLIKLLEKQINEIANCAAAPGFNLYDGSGCIEPETDPVVNGHAKESIPSCPATDETPFWNGTNWVCRALTGVTVDCLVTRTVPGGCVAFSNDQVNHGTSDTGYCSMSGDKGCYSTVSCNMGVQTFSSEQCYGSDWVTGPWQIPCYDDDPSPLVEDWKWNRSVTCPVVGDCDPSKKPATVGACGVVVSHGQCGAGVNSCVKGTFSDLPDDSTNAYWDCLGVNGGSDATCSAPLPPPANCFDSVAGSGCSTFQSLNHGDISSWSCDAGYTGSCGAECNNGSFINTTNTCASVPDCAATTINKSRTTTDGKQFCNFSLPAGNNGDTINSSNPAGLCDWTNAGDANCSGTFTCNGSSWTTNTWSASCVIGPVSGVCGSSKDSCTKGTFSDTADDASNYKWDCKGIDGGADASCTSPKSAITYSWSIDSTFGSCSTTCGSGTQSRTVTCRRDSDNVVVADANCTNPKPATSQSCTDDATCLWRWIGDGEVGNDGQCTFRDDSCAGDGYMSTRLCCGSSGTPSGSNSCVHNSNPLAVVDPLQYHCKE